MTKEEFLEQDKLINQVYKDTEDYGRMQFVREIVKLQNNWNELKEWLEEQKEFIENIPTFSKDIKNNHIGMVGAYKNTLEKMLEIESRK